MDYYNKKHALQVMQSIYLRLKQDKYSFTRKNEGASIVYHQYKQGSSVYINLNKTRNTVYISIDDRTGSVEWSSWFWKDKELKEVASRLINFDKESDINADNLLLKHFPEIVDTEFEEQVLNTKK